MAISFLRIKALTNYYLCGIKNNPLRLFLLVTWPVSDLLIWSFTANYIQTNHFQSDFFLPTIVCFLSWSILWQIQNEICYPFLRDIYSKNLRNLLITPTNFTEISLAVFIASLSKILITISTISLITYLLFSINLLRINPILIFYIANLIIFGLALGIVSIALIIRFGPQIDFLTRTIPFFLWPFFGVFYPRQNLPGLFKNISYLLPPSYIFENIRSTLIYQKFSLSDLSTAAVLNLIYLFLAVVLLQFMFLDAKKKGNLARI